MHSGNPIARAQSSLRIAELDGLRGVAIGLVLYRHYLDNLVTAPKHGAGAVLLAAGRLSWSGVDLFFVLSGFLIGGILLDTRNSENYFRRFYIRRACRILPLYYALCLWVWAATATGDWTLAPFLRPLFHPMMPWASYLTYTQNLWMAHRSIFGASGIGVSWSLAVEEQFYFTLPLLMRFLPARMLKWTLIVCASLAPMIRMGLYFHRPYADLGCYVLMPCRADALLLGVLCALLVRDERGSSWLKQHAPWLWGGALLMVPGLGLLEWNYRDPYSLRMISIGYTWLAVFYALILLHAVTHAEGWLGGILRLRGLRWLGSIAYGVYLWHLVFLGLCLGLLRYHGAWIRSWSDAGAVLLALGLTLIVCAISWKYFEKPIVQWGYRFADTEHADIRLRHLARTS